MKINKKELALAFVKAVWNENKLEELENYINPNFIDYSLPYSFPKNIDGTKRWVMATSLSFEHHTIVEDIIAEDNKVFIRISMKLKHVGIWRNYPATGKEVFTSGYRLFEFLDDKIISQWASIDGNAIERQIAGAAHSCNK